MAQKKQAKGSRWKTVNKDKYQGNSPDTCLYTEFGGFFELYLTRMYCVVACTSVVEGA